MVAKMLSRSDSWGESTVVVHRVFKASGVVRDRPVTARGFGVTSTSSLETLFWGRWRRVLPGLSSLEGEVLSGMRGLEDIEPTLDRYLRAWLDEWAISSRQIAVDCLGCDILRLRSRPG